MDVLDEELLQFWRVLNQYEVKYIMIGGFATRFHGFDRETGDVDLWLLDSQENRKRLRTAIRQLGYGDIIELETMEFVPGWTSIYLGNALELDIVTSMKGLENLSFEECYKYASIADIEGVQIPFLHINHLIQNKKTVNRLKDQIDVQELERIKKIREQEG